jgi:hypothetical protein
MNRMLHPVFGKYADSREKCLRQSEITTHSFIKFRLPDLDRVLTWFFGKQYGTKV